MCVKPVAGIETCQARHVGVVKTGRMAVPHGRLHRRDDLRPVIAPPAVLGLSGYTPVAITWSTAAQL